jgi:hypothetical protein
MGIPCRSPLLFATLALGLGSGCCMSSHALGGDSGDVAIDPMDGDSPDAVEEPSSDRREHDVLIEYNPDRYIDPGCDAGDPITSFACELYTNVGCLSGEACYPYVIYPSDPYGQEEYGSFCYPAGPGTQGSPCTDSSQCAAGHACFVTGQGTQCLRFCSLTGGEPRCPPGLICGWTDNPAIGACL